MITIPPSIPVLVACLWMFFQGRLLWATMLASGAKNMSEKINIFFSHMMSCPKCLSFWITLCFTHDFIWASAVSMGAAIIDKQTT